MSWKISSSKSYPWKKSSKQTSRLRTSPAAAPGLPFASAWRSPRIWRPWRRCKSARRWGRPWRRRSWRSCWGPGAPVGPRWGPGGAPGDQDMAMGQYLYILSGMNIDFNPAMTWGEQKVSGFWPIAIWMGHVTGYLFFMKILWRFLWDMNC